MDLDRGDWRTLWLDRVERASRTGHRFAPVTLADAAGMVTESITSAPYRYQATVRFECRPDELARRVPSSVGTISADGEGSLLRVGSDHLGALIAHLVSLGLPFEVLEPAELRDQILQVATRLAGAHAAAGSAGASPEGEP